MGYRRNYRRSHYSRRGRSKRYGRSIGPEQGIAMLLVLGVVWLYMSGLLQVIFSTILVIAVIVLPILGLIWLIRKSSTGSNSSPATSLSIESGVMRTAQEVDQGAINSDKHGCKCYMEGLTPGEQEIAYELSEGLNYKEYYIFNNLTIPSQHNGSSQIDHVVVSKYGIFVIESKDYHGWIFGSRDNEHWTQTFPKGDNTQFKNPLHQNWSHIMSLRSLFLHLQENVFKNIVVFSESSEFKTEPIENVVGVKDLIETIQKHTEYVISEGDVEFVIGKLSFLCQTADISREQHLENISARHS